MGFIGVLLVLIIIYFFLFVIASLLFTGIIAIVSAIVGGTTISLLIKNALAKKLILLGFTIVFSVGVLFITPFVIGYFSLSYGVFHMMSLVVSIVILILSIFGAISSQQIQHHIGKYVVMGLFILFAVLAVSYLIFYLALWSYLVQATTKANA